MALADILRRGAPLHPSPFTLHPAPPLHPLTSCHRCVWVQARSEGFIGVEGDDPAIYWASKSADGSYKNEGRKDGATPGV